MDYNTFLHELKNIYIPYLLGIIPEEAYENSPLITKDVYANTIYTDLMAIGYNFGDLDKALEDKIESTFTLPFVVPKTQDEVVKEINETARLYPYAIEIFSNSHKKMQAGENLQDILDYVKHKLNND